MMELSLLQIIAIIKAITEFLPISSSALIAPAVLGWLIKVLFLT